MSLSVSVRIHKLSTVLGHARGKESGICGLLMDRPGSLRHQVKRNDREEVLT